MRPVFAPARTSSSALGSVGERDLARADVVQPARTQVGGDPLPHRATLLDRHRDGVDAEQRDAAQDEREDRRLQPDAAGVAGRRNGAAVLQRAQDVRQRRRADAVDGSGPTLTLERLAGAGRLVAADDLGGAEPFRNPSASGLPVDAATS